MKLIVAIKTHAHAVPTPKKVAVVMAVPQAAYLPAAELVPRGAGSGSPQKGQGVIAIEVGSCPTGIAFPALLLAVEIGVTVSEVALAT
jgi:hypothetical protein